MPSKITRGLLFIKSQYPQTPYPPITAHHLQPLSLFLLCFYIYLFFLSQLCFVCCVFCFLFFLICIFFGIYLFIFELVFKFEIHSLSLGLLFDLSFLFCWLFSGYFFFSFLCCSGRKEKEGRTDLSHLFSLLQFLRIQTFPRFLTRAFLFQSFWIA